METDIKRFQIIYEIAMSIGRSLDLEQMLKQSLSVFIDKLNCSAGGIFLYVKPGHLQPKLRTFLLPRIFAGSEEYNELTDIINRMISERIVSDNEELFPPKLLTIGSSQNLVLEIPETGFIFLNKTDSKFDRELVSPLQELTGRLSVACIACYQKDALIQSQYDLELRIAHRTRELESSNNELKKAYDELQKAQNQLVLSEKMASIGQLAAGVAHEINNPTGYISSNLHTMTEYVNIIETFYELTSKLVSGFTPDTDPESTEITGIIKALIEKEDLPFVIKDSKQLLEESIDGADRIKEIVAGLRKFGRSDNSDFQEADVNQAIEDALRLTWNELKYKCEVDKKLGKLKPIPCKADQLTQVFINILVNASQAIESHGKVTIESRLENDMIIIRISDDGKGIPEENLTRLFDPFFTTKEVGKGTGLGLSISHGIIQKHGGIIEVESKEGNGTTFIIKLPVSSKIPGNQASPSF